MAVGTTLRQTESGTNMNKKIFIISNVEFVEQTELNTSIITFVVSLW